ncbi:MAG TPA: DUF4350 domain-containing protein [Solirubrobacteraceae bacterium]|nr:DUF4350 domain-containing protein [Solirubrobacteraceae bacterium]
MVTAFFLVGIAANAISPSPSGRQLSSYATTPGGVAAWAELLARDGHAVRQLRGSASARTLPADATLVVLSHAGLENLDGAGLGGVQDFLNRGGRVILGGRAARIAGRLRGDIVEVPHPAFLENSGLAKGDDAYRSLTVAGPSGRPVYFDETIHGYGAAIGLAALPERWWFAIVALALALGFWALSRGVRLGGSDPLPAPQPSPRTAYITAMAQTLARTAKPDELRREMELAAEREAAFRRSL